MQIAPNFKAAKWKALALDNAASANWDVAVSALDSRIRERYIAPADFLVAAEKETPAIERRFGFAVLAIDCLLVETLGAFLEGLEETTNRSKETFCTTNGVRHQQMGSDTIVRLIEPQHIIKEALKGTLPLLVPG
jgi:hypothetical protein